MDHLTENQCTRGTSYGTNLKTQVKDQPEAQVKDQPEDQAKDQPEAQAKRLFGRLPKQYWEYSQ